MAEGGPDQVVVPVEGGGNSLRPFVLHNKRKLIKKIYGMKRGTEGGEREAVQTKHWKAGRALPPLSLPEQLQER